MGNPRFHYAWVILVVATCVVFGALGLARFGYTMLLPPMKEGLGLNDAGAGSLATANLIGYLIMSLLGGALAARYGPRVVIAAGLALVAAAMFMTGLAQSFAAATVWRLVTGLGSGASNVPVMGLLAAWFSRSRRGLATGIAVTGSSFALILCGPLVPWVLTRRGAEGWRTCWFLFGGAAAALAVVAWLGLRNRPSSLGLQPLGQEGEETPPGPAAGSLPWASVYRSRLIWHVGLVYVAFGFSYIIYLTFFTRYLITEGGYTHASAGRLFMLMGWLSLLCGLIWGTVSDVIGRKATLVVVYLVHALSFSLFALWKTPAGFTLSAVLFGISAWSIPAIMAALCGDLLGPRLSPAGLGFVTLFFGIGQAAAPAAAGALAVTYGSLSPAMLLAAGVALSGAVGALALHRPGPRPQAAAC
jgi:sugar phosphate permease